MQGLMINLSSIMEEHKRFLHPINSFLEFIGGRNHLINYGVFLLVCFKKMKQNKKREIPLFESRAGKHMKQ